MSALHYEWTAEDERRELVMVPVPGTNGTPFKFNAARGRDESVRDFYIGRVPVTQALWLHVMGSNPAKLAGPKNLDCPVENISWHQITEPGGFLEQINASGISDALAPGKGLRFRLPSEIEWEYAARGGPKWTDGLNWSGSNNPDDVAWYGPRWSRRHQLGVDLFGWRKGWRLAHVFRRRHTNTRTHPVATKAPNQLGLYDMSGNVWEWCQDEGPNDGERVLRGGSHQNWDLHCTCTWRYGITPDAHDQYLGLRLAMS